MDFTGVIIDHAYRVLMKRSDTPDAEVYCGEPLAAGPPVAIAFLREEIAADDEDVKETFLKDGRALCRFTHPNVIEMFDCGIYQGRPYAITALPVGEPLHAEIGALKQDPQRAVRAIAGLYEAIEATHAASLIHGSLGPSSLVLTPEDRLQLIDLPTARLRAALARARGETVVPSKALDLEFVTELARNLLAPFAAAPEPKAPTQPPPSQPPVRATSTVTVHAAQAAAAPARVHAAPPPPPPPHAIHLVQAPRLVAIPRPPSALVSPPAHARSMMRREHLPHLGDDADEGPVLTFPGPSPASKQGLHRSINLTIVCTVLLLMVLVLLRT